MGKSPLSALGQVLVTGGARFEIELAGRTVEELLHWHQFGDSLFGEPRVVDDGQLITSVYKLATGTKVWVVTDPGLTGTVVILPSEFPLPYPYEDRE